MEHEPSLNADALREIEEIRSYYADGASIPKDKILAWLQSPCDAVRATAFDYLISRSEAILLGCTDVEEYAIVFLRNAIESNDKDDYRYSRFDAFLALRAWIAKLNLSSPRGKSTLKRIREMLEEICVKDQGAVRVSVIHSLLEHVFVDSKVKNFFASWRRNSALRDIYAEATQLAAELRELRFDQCDPSREQEDKQSPP